MSTKNNIFQDLKEVLKEPSSTPKQKIVPIKESVLKGEKQLTVYIDKEKLKKLKILSAQLELSLKEMFNEAITQYWLKESTSSQKRSIKQIALEEAIEEAQKQ